MKVFRHIEELPADFGPAIVTVGNFDGIHRAHQAVIAEVVRRAREIGGQSVSEISQRDGVKYIMADDSWLLIRPSGTEPVLRVYAEGRTQEMVKSLMGYGQKVAESVV